MNFLSELRGRFATALETLEPDAGPLADLVLPSQDAKFGDYQANCAMPLGKRLGRPPRKIAEQLLSRLEVSDLCDQPEVAGPGFINLRVRDTWLVEQLQKMAHDDHLTVAPAEAPQTYVLDYSSPNVAKPMHVGHIRSTVIGDALCNVLRRLGHRVISDNHIGDWGTQFGMIIYGYKHFAKQLDMEEGTVEQLGRLYRLVHQLLEDQTARNEKIPTVEQQIVEQAARLEEMHDQTVVEGDKERKKEAKRLRQAEARLVELRATLDDLRRFVGAVDADPLLVKLSGEHSELGAAVLAETAALHAGDSTNRALWERFLPACRAEMDETYQRLGVTFDHTLGESFYHDRLAAVVDDLTTRGLVRESDGAACVFLEGYDAPLIVRKRDGAFLYATTDLATIQYRMEQWSPDAILYVVDHRQSLHFEQMFATARRWGYDHVELEHIRFGTVLGENGRPYKTRTGTAVGLGGLLDEAVERAYQIVCANDDARDRPLLDEAERQQVAKRVGIGAIKYADLAHNRESDYVFSYDKMLAMTGNTAAYMQYSYARVRSIFTKGDIDLQQLRNSSASILLDRPEERALAVSLLQFSETLERVATDYRPNHLTAYLFELASKYSSFFENCPVLKADDASLRDSRLRLCDLTARTLASGLHLLGIQVVERM